MEQGVNLLANFPFSLPFFSHYRNMRTSSKTSTNSTKRYTDDNFRAIKARVAFFRNLFFNVANSRQPKVVTRQLEIEFLRGSTWQHVQRGHSIYYQLISSLNSKGKSLKSNKSPFSSLTEIVKLCKC